MSLAVSAFAYGGVIPLPADIVPGTGSFNVSRATVVRVPPGDADAAGAARYLIELWTRTNGLTLPLQVGAPGSGATSTDEIEFRRLSGLEPEAYELSVAP